jgi:hypothetical protein
MGGVVERFLQRIERRGTDIAIDDTDRPHGHGEVALEALGLRVVLTMILCCLGACRRMDQRFAHA